MQPQQFILPKWILILSALFALMEIAVSASMIFAPKTVLENIEVSGPGVNYLVFMWAARQFALGVIIAFATFKRSAAMLTICYIFLLVMFIGDMMIGISQGDNALIVASVIMSIIAAALLAAIAKRR